MHLLLVLWISIIGKGKLIAQPADPFFKTIGTANGLSHAKVNCILQDKRGFIWIGTEDGLNRYDGHRFLVFHSQPNDTSCISGNIITDLHEDSQGLLWIATADGGLTRYNYRLRAGIQFKQYKYHPSVIDGIPGNKINKITEDNAGNLWLATSNHSVVRFNKQTSKFDIPVKTAAKTILTLKMDEADTLLVGQAGGSLMRINTCNLSARIDEHYNDPHSKLYKTDITAIHKSKENIIWLGSKNKTLHRYQPGTGPLSWNQPTPANRGFPADEIVSFTEDRVKRIWMACRDSGVTVYDQNSKVFKTYQHDNRDGTLVNNQVNAVYTDHAGIVWIGTNNGLSVLNPVYSPFEQHYLPKNADGKTIFVYDFYRDKGNALWIGTSEGIYIKRPGEAGFEHRRIVFKQQQVAVTKLFVDIDNTFYLGTNYSLFKYNPHTNQVSLLPNTGAEMVMKGLLTPGIRSILRDTINKHPVLIISPYGPCLTYYDLANRMWVSGFDSAKKNVVSNRTQGNAVKKIVKDKTGNIWLASNVGLGDWKKNARPIAYFMSDLGNEKSISSNDVFDIEEENSGNLWVSTYGGGLNFFHGRENTFTHITGSSNLTEGINTDLQGNVWMICNGHIHKYNPGTKVYSCYDPPGLKCIGGVTGYLYEDNQGILYAGGTNFYLSFSPYDIAKISSEPNVYITDFRIFDTSHNDLLDREVIHLNYKQNYFSFEFSAPEFTSNHVRYQYILEGFDKDWINAGTRNFASYSNLPGGKYKFKVKAGNWDGNNVERYQSVFIVVKPPFWLEWWFYVLLITIIVPVSYLVYRYRLNEYLKRQEIRNSIARDLHDHIGSTLSSISIYSGVAKVYQKQNQADRLSQVLQSIGETASETISEMSDIVWAINPKNDHVESIIQKISSYAVPLCRASNIQFTVNCDSRVSSMILEMAARKNLYLILKESINNAIKHSGCNRLIVDIRLNKKHIELSVQDNGRGFDTGAKTASLPSVRGGNGLGNIKSRAAEIGAELKLTSNLHHGTSIKLVFSV